ncbi:MAG: methyltransferase domain-containing protein [Thermoplasmatota archaeon]
MDLCFELSKEYTQLASAEIQACIQADHLSANCVKETPDVFILTTEEPRKVLLTMTRRLSQTFCINHHYFTSPVDMITLQEKALSHPLSQQGSVAVSYRNRSTQISSQKIVKSLAEIYTKDRRVSLKHPDSEIRVIITDEKLYVGQLLASINRSQFQQRKAHHRPFFSPISLHPLLARLLVNLSKVPSNGLLLDPFCGTGGILIEAGLMGVNIIGCDIEEKMIHGTNQNLNHYGLSSQALFSTDIGSLDKTIDQQIDAVVTDFPYGKATSTQGEDISCLYQRAFQQIAAVLKKDGYAVIGLPQKTYTSFAEAYLIPKKYYPIRVHQSLTRHFFVYQKI